MRTLLTITGLALVAPAPLSLLRRLRLDLRWWMTASPFLLSGIVLLLHGAGALQRADRPLLDAVTAAVAACAVGLLFAVRAAHRRPAAPWDRARADDFVDSGPYARIRHPLHSAFLLLLVAALLALPSPLTAASLAWGLVASSMTARSEEDALLASPLAARYRAYVNRTGRFLPRMRCRE